jgi:hypothetical protein
VTTPIEDISLIDDMEVVDAIMFFVHNVELSGFSDLWLPERNPKYVKEKWNLMHKALPRFWGTLDPGNKTRFLAVVKKYYTDKHKKREG